MKRYGRIAVEYWPELLETIEQYKCYGIPQERSCQLLGISKTYYHRLKNPKEGQPKPTARIGFNANTILPEEEKAIVEFAKEHPNYMHRELTWRVIDAKVTYISTSTMYRILRKNGLIAANRAKKRYDWMHKYSNEAHEPDELWQTDITYIQYKNRDVYQLSFIDVYSRFIVLSVTLLNMESRTVRDVFEKYYSENKGNLKRKPIIQSDNGSSYIGHEFKQVISKYTLEHTYCHPGSPTENVIIERWHRTIKENIAEYKEPESFEELMSIIEKAVHYYNYERYHQSLGYVIPYEFYRGTPDKIFEERKRYCKTVRESRRLVNIEREKPLSIFLPA